MKQELSLIIGFEWNIIIDWKLASGNCSGFLRSFEIAMEKSITLPMSLNNFEWNLKWIQLWQRKSIFCSFWKFWTSGPPVHLVYFCYNLDRRTACTCFDIEWILLLKLKHLHEMVIKLLNFKNINDINSRFGAADKAFQCMNFSTSVFYGDL